MKPKFSLANFSSFSGTLCLALLVGLITALGCICFHLLIEFFTQFFFGVVENDTFISTLSTLTTLERILIPASGGLLVGIILTYLHVTEAEGEGVPQVLRAIVFKKSKIRLLVAPIKILTTAITLGSGGSAGREGPIVQIGSAIGSSVGQLLKQNESTTKLLLAAGAAAGIGGTFGAPLAGILFSLELILKTITLRIVFILGAAAFLSNYLVSGVLGFEGLRLILPNSFIINIDLILVSLILGAISGVLAVYFGRTIKLMETFFHWLRTPLFIKTTIGGLLIGFLALYFPYIHEPATYPLMVDLLAISNLPLLFLIGLLFVKIVATAITIGSGGSGGVLAPALLTGLIFGYVMAMFIPGLGWNVTADVIAFGLIGMAGVFAGVTHAPFMSTILLYEITDEPMVIPLIALSTAVSYFTAKYLSSESVYTEHMSKRRIV
ncbi:MAG TPA: chloride channel protein [Candidatus Paceibacterota bacterium]|nr:chloride channel protein [Candidatus Paceibacterota bacterium]HMO83039.1 chloride channel protein [Candidatus Paceibacterota bacterium]